MKRTPLVRKTPMKRSGFKGKPFHWEDCTADGKPIKVTPYKGKTPTTTVWLPSQLKRTPIRKVSKSKAGWLRKYEKAKAASIVGGWRVRDAKTGLWVSVELMEPHHVAGRIGKRILIFAWIRKEHHTSIHDNETQARKDGWLRDEFFSYPKNPNQPRPWGEGALVNENFLDD